MPQRLAPWSSGKSRLHTRRPAFMKSGAAHCGARVLGPRQLGRAKTCNCASFRAVYRLSHPLEMFPIRSHLDPVTPKGVRRAICTAWTRAPVGRSDRQVSAAIGHSRWPGSASDRESIQNRARSPARYAVGLRRFMARGSMRKRTVPVIRCLSAAFAGALASGAYPTEADVFSRPLLAHL